MYMPNWERNQQRFEDLGIDGQEGRAGDIVGLGGGGGPGKRYLEDFEVWAAHDCNVYAHN